MEYLVGLSLAIGVSLAGTIAGLDRDRAFYPAMTLAIGSYYLLFAVMAGSAEALSLETAAFIGFAAIAVIGFRKNLWLVAAALVGHGVFDLVHSHVVANDGVPAWWPMFCMSYDVTAGLYLAWLLRRSYLVTGKPGAGHPIRFYVQSELDSAAALEAQPAASFHKLERAHVLSQASTLEHVRVHWHMLMWGVRQRSVREIAGQIVRIVGAATKTAVGLVPAGNTGGANVSPFKPMPVPADLAWILAATKVSEPGKRAGQAPEVDPLSSGADPRDSVRLQ